MTGRRLVKLDGPAPPEMKEALRGAGLPVDDIRDDLARFLRFEDDAGAIGWAAIEPYGENALLRSVVILDHRRGEGAGFEMVSEVVRAAAGLGAERLWLLTEGAAPFFARLGFAAADRNSAPEPIAQTSEFRFCCPASATCMTLNLAAR